MSDPHTMLQFQIFTWQHEPCLVHDLSNRGCQHSCWVFVKIVKAI